MVSELNHTVLSSGVFLGHSFAYDRLAVPVECWRERNPLNIAVQLSTYSFSMNLTCCFWKLSLAPTSLFTGVVAPFHETLSLLMTAFAFCFLLFPEKGLSIPLHMSPKCSAATFVMQCMIVQFCLRTRNRLMHCVSVPLPSCSLKPLVDILWTC